MKFNVHKNDGDFSGGLRGFFEYKDLGIAEATEGKGKCTCNKSSNWS